MPRQSIINLTEDRDACAMTISLPESSKDKVSSRKQQKAPRSSVHMPQASVKRQSSLLDIVQARKPPQDTQLRILPEINALQFSLHAPTSRTTLDDSVSSSGNAKKQRSKGLTQVAHLGIRGDDDDFRSIQEVFRPTESPNFKSSRLPSTTSKASASRFGITKKSSHGLTPTKHPKRQFALSQHAKPLSPFVQKKVSVGASTTGTIVMNRPQQALCSENPMELNNRHGIFIKAQSNINDIQKIPQYASTVELGLAQRDKGINLVLDDVNATKIPPESTPEIIVAAFYAALPLHLQPQLFSALHDGFGDPLDDFLLEKAFEDFADLEQGISGARRDYLVAPSGSLNDSIAFVFNYPTFTTTNSCENSHVADSGSPVISQVLDKGYSALPCLMIEAYSRRQHNCPKQDRNNNRVPQDDWSPELRNTHLDFLHKILEMSKAKIIMWCGSRNGTLLNTKATVSQRFFRSYKALIDGFEIVFWVELDQKSSIRRLHIAIRHPESFFHIKHMTEARLLDLQYNLPAVLLGQSINLTYWTAIFSQPRVDVHLTNNPVTQLIHYRSLEKQGTPPFTWEELKLPVLAWLAKEHNIMSKHQFEALSQQERWQGKTVSAVALGLMRDKSNLTSTFDAGAIQARAKAAAEGKSCLADIESTKTRRQNSKYAYLYRLGTGAEANVRVKCATCGYVKSDPAPAYVVKGVSAGRYVAGKLRCPGCPSVDGKNPERFFKPYDSRLAFVSRDDLFREVRRTSSQAIR